MADPLFEERKTEPLFDDMPDLPEKYPISDFGVSLHLERITKIDREMERLEAQQKDSQEWFRRRLLRLAEARDRHVLDTAQMLKDMGEKTCATPFGTATLRKSTNTLWPDDSRLVEWVNSLPQNIDRSTLLHTKASPDKAAIKSLLKSNADITLPGFEVKDTETLSIRKAS
jgi:hypothetical protein